MMAAFIGRHISVGANKYVGGIERTHTSGECGCEKVRHSSHHGLQIHRVSLDGVWGERVVIPVDGVVAATAVAAQ